MENGKTYIPDRLLFSKNLDEVVVIDYKTGAEKPAHKIQITEYSSALQLMGYKNIKKVLRVIIVLVAAMVSLAMVGFVMFP